MNKIFFLFSLTLVYTTLGYPPEGQGSQWGGRPGNQWGGGRPDQQWGPGPNSWQPNPEPECSVIPRNAKTVGISAVVNSELTFNSIYPCDSDARIDQISFNLTRGAQLTCNGVVVSKDDFIYNITFIDRNGNRKREEVTLTNYTIITTFNNGNFDYVECGIISNGRCAGDEWAGIGIYQADDQTGCCKDGISGAQALVRKIQVTGRCSTKCSLGASRATFGDTINNKGFVNTGFEAEEEKESETGKESTTQNY